MGTSFGTELERLARNGTADGLDRARAVYEMQRHGVPPGAGLLSALVADRNADVRAAAVYVAGVQGELAAQASPPQAKTAAAALKDGNPLVRRRAAEALVRMGQSPDKPSLAPGADIYALLNDPDRFVRWAGRTALERTARDEWKDRALSETNPLGSIEAMIALVNTATDESLLPLIDKQFAMMKQGNLSLDNTLRLFRAFQYTTTGIKGGLSPQQRRQLHGLIVNQFPAQDERLNRELSLMLGYAGQPEGLTRILAAVPKGDENQPLQLHYLYALRVVKDGWTAEQKLQLADILGRTAKWRGGAQFATFIGNIFDEFSGLYATDEEKQALAQRAPEFSPLTPAELEEIKNRLAQGGRGGGRGNPANPLAARRAGRVVSRQEMLEEAVYQPQQQLDAAGGQQLFEKNCASCHRFGSLGNDAGVPALDLTSSALRASKYAMLEAIMFPDRKVAPELETTLIDTVDGRTVTALVLRETGQGLSVLTREGTATDLPTAQVKGRRKVKASLMTEAMADAMNQTQWRNLLAFLTGPPPTGTAANR
jgi:putative heme-binding domain-containing protein